MCTEEHRKENVVQEQRTYLELSDLEQRLKDVLRTMEERTSKEIELRDHLIERVLAEIPYCRLNGHRTDRLPNNANFSFQFIEGNRF